MRGTRGETGTTTRKVENTLEETTTVPDASSGEPRDIRLSRDVVPCAEDKDTEDTDPLHWVPYIHFGI